MAKPKKTTSYEKASARAARAMALNKARLESSGPSGLASDKTLQGRGYDPDPQGGAPKLPRQSAPPTTAKKRRKRRKSA